MWGIDESKNEPDRNTYFGGNDTGYIDYTF